eukprot:351446_1
MNVQPVEVFGSLCSMQTDQKRRFLAYISAAMGAQCSETGKITEDMPESWGAQCSETGKITEDMLESWGAQWVFVFEHPAGTVIGTGFILRPSDACNDYILSGLCYDPELIQIAESILTAAVKVRDSHFPSRNLVI